MSLSTLSDPPPAAPAAVDPGSNRSVPRKWRRRLLWWIGALLAALWLEQLGISLIFQSTRFRALLDERLEFAFGRSVQVGRYSFSLWEGPQLEAESVTVDEDPRFGYEYFLRADRLTAQLRWRSLLRGQIELGTISFDHPSLNLVRASDGQWNVEAWLPALSNGPARIPSANAITPRVRRIEVDSGRINFKRGVEKLPFAFVDVNGAVEEDGQGRWLVQLEAEPMRAATQLQRAGILQLQGHLGGTSSHLRPADLQFSWHEASLSDVLRLTRGYDYGIRGDASLDLRARTEGAPWDLAGKLQLSGIHRWDLPSRADSPAVNLQATARWWPEESRIDLSNALIEAPASNVRARGVVDWNAPTTHAGDANQTRVQFLSAGIQVSDLLQWVRAFHPAVTQDFSVLGQMGVDATLSGWPPQIERGAIATDGLEVVNRRNPIKVLVNRTVIDLAPGHFRLLPAMISINHEPTAVRVEADLERRNNWTAGLHASGEMASLRELFDMTRLFGWPLPAGWGIAGGARFDIRWQGAYPTSLRTASGFVETNGLMLQLPFLNRPITQVRARYDSKSNDQRILIAGADAFGAHWSGGLNRDASEPAWQFALKADRLSAADLDAWIDPQHAQGILERVFPFLSDSQPPVAVPTALQGRGRLELDQFNLGSVTLKRVRTDAAIDGRHLELSNAHADFYGGAVEGALRADLLASPEYEVQTKFSRVDVGSLADLSQKFHGDFSGRASGEIAFRMKGTGRQRLLESLGCDGQAEIEGAEIRGIDFPASLRDVHARDGATEFRRLDSNFTCDSGKFELSGIQISAGDSDFDGFGSVDSGGGLDVQLRMLPALGRKADLDTDLPAVQYRLAGPLLNPDITRVAQPFPTNEEKARTASHRR